jgi:hypothetical protein
VAQTIGTNYIVTIPTLSDPASIIEAFKYYHTGSLAGPPQVNSVEKHFIDMDTRVDSVEAAIGTPYSNGSNINARITALEAGSGNVAGLYVKTGPTSNVDYNTSNILSAGGSTIVPLMIKGINGQSSDLQQWFVYGDNNPRVKINSGGRLFTYDGTSVAEVVTLSGTQELTNKVVTGAALTVAGTSATIDLTYRAKFVNFTSTAAKTATIPANATTAFPVGTTITITNLAASGNLTIAAAGGVTLRSQDSRVLVFPYGTVVLFKVDTDTWTLNFMSKERQTFIQTTDPGAAAIDGDIWYKY